MLGSCLAGVGSLGWLAARRKLGENISENRLISGGRLLAAGWRQRLRMKRVKAGGSNKRRRRIGGIAKAICVIAHRWAASGICLRRLRENTINIGEENGGENTRRLMAAAAAASPAAAAENIISSWQPAAQGGSGWRPALAAISRRIFGGGGGIIWQRRRMAKWLIGINGGRNGKMT